ncbi:MAG: hypothetical protein WB608_13240 [Terracidiphilus sp.]
MTESMEEQELKDRLRLIESMISEGRRSTENWGWMFVFWGVAYYIAIAWATWGHSSLAWPVTMIVASLLSGVLASRKAGRHPETTMGRAIGAVWIGMGISLFLVLMSLAFSGRYEGHVFIAIIGGMLGGANATSSIILKWKMQFGCAVVWWASAIVACFGTESQGSIAFLAAIFVCQILFGIYGMILKSHKRSARQRPEGAAHA